MNPLSNGTVVGIDYDSEKYHAVEGERGKPNFVMSRSQLMEFEHCPRRWLRGVKETRDKSTDFGGLVDCLVTNPKSFEKSYAVTPLEYVNKDGDRKPWNFNATVCQQWREEQGERTIIKPDMMADAHAVETRLKEDKRIAELIKKSLKQVCVRALYKDAETKLTVPIKTLIDFVLDAKSDALADLKTTRNAAPRAWAKTVYDMDYHAQAAMYLDAYNCSVIDGNVRKLFYHVIVENVQPFETARRLLSEDFINIGRAKYVRALQRYCQCLKSGMWPGFDDEGNDIVNGWRLVEPEAWMIL